MGPRFVKLQLELGGKDPTYVCEDANVKNAAASRWPTARCTTPARAAARSSASTCTRRSTTPSSTAFVETVKGFKPGDPMSEDTYIGAITRAPQLDVLDAQVADAKAKGATLLAGGERGAGPGNWFEPTVFSNVDHSME
jgi:acyl-CoA reductase-like NAD-dependent aldehyde dehydrogenase